MRKIGVLSREEADCMKQVLAAIGRALRGQYDTAEPLPDRLADLVRKMEQQEGLESLR
jgi:hypothetical protein